MAPVGRHFGQRHQNKGAVLKARMGQDQLVGCKAGLLFRGKAAPGGLPFGIGQHQIPHRQQIKVQRPPRPALHAFAPKTRLDPVQSGQWRRAEDRLVAGTGQTLLLQQLGVLVFDAGTRWVNGSLADLQPGRRLVLSRDDAGRLTEILIPNPEDTLDSDE